MRILAIEHLREFRDAEIAEALEDAYYEGARRWAEFEKAPCAETLNSWREMNFYIGDLEDEDIRRYIRLVKAETVNILKPAARREGKAGAMQI